MRLFNPKRHFRKAGENGEGNSEPFHLQEPHISACLSGRTALSASGHAPAVPGMPGFCGGMSSGP